MPRIQAIGDTPLGVLRGEVTPPPTRLRGFAAFSARYAGFSSRVGLAVGAAARQHRERPERRCVARKVVRPAIPVGPGRRPPQRDEDRDVCAVQALQDRVVQIPPVRWIGRIAWTRGSTRRDHVPAKRQPHEIDAESIEDLDAFRRRFGPVEQPSVVLDPVLNTRRRRRRTGRKQRQ